MHTKTCILFFSRNSKHSMLLQAFFICFVRMSSSLPVAAVCQMTATPDKDANFSACTRLVEQAKEGGASMVFLPEGFDYIGSNREETLVLSETLDGDIITRYTHLARLVS